jgi:hypothetical protein
MKEENEEGIRQEAASMIPPLSLDFKPDHYMRPSYRLLKCCWVLDLYEPDLSFSLKAMKRFILFFVGILSLYETVALSGLPKHAMTRSAGHKHRTPDAWMSCNGAHERVPGPTCHGALCRGATRNAQWHAGTGPPQSGLPVIRTPTSRDI